MKTLSSWARLLFFCSFVQFTSQLYSQPIDFSSCAACTSIEIGFLTKVSTLYQGINGFNPSAPSTYGLIANRKYSGSVYPVANPFLGENWYPILTEKQTLTGTVHGFGVSNWGDESDWNIYLLPAAGFEDFIAHAIPYADGSWFQDEQGHFLIEAEITPDEHRYGNPWFNNTNSQTVLLHKLITAYGPFVREEAHANRPEIHPCEQLWWKEGVDAFIVLLVNDDSNRFKRRADTIVIVNGQPTVIAGDYSARRVTTFAYEPWAKEKNQEAEIQVAFELNPSTDGFYVTIQAVDDFNFFTGSNYPDVREGTKYSVTYKGNSVLTVEESSQIDQFIGVSFKNVCFNRVKGTLQGYIVFNTSVGNGDGKEGFVALRIDKKNVGVNATPQIMTGDIANTWKPFAVYDNNISFSDIISSDMFGKGIVDGIIDFNGNGKSDLFAKQGDRWMVLFDGKGNWQEINSSSIDVRELRFGDVNGNGKTDILRVGPNHKVVVSYDGVGMWTELTDAGEQNNLIQVADFNGDHRTDLVYFKLKILPNQLYRGDMYVKYGGSGSWKLLNENYHLAGPTDYVDNFRFGNFNGDNITDLFRYFNNKFNVYWNGKGDIKELCKPAVLPRMSDLLFATGIMMPRETDVIYVDPISKKWTVYFNGQPGSLPLDVKHGDPSTIRFADLDPDPAVDLIAMDFVRGDPNNAQLQIQPRVLIDHSAQLKYVEGSLKRKTVGNKEGLFYDQDLLYYPGTKPTRRRRAAELEINAVKEKISAATFAFTPVMNVVPDSGDVIILGRIKDVPVRNKLGSTVQITFKINPETINKSISAAAITAVPGKITKTSNVEPNDWSTWRTFLNSVAKPNKKVLLTKAPGVTTVTKKISFEVHPLYSGIEGKTASAVEMSEFIEEMNEAIYGSDVARRKAIFGNGDVFTITWSFSLLNLSSGQKSTPTVNISNGKFKNSKINFSFPNTQEPIRFAATATITDKFGYSNIEPLEFVFYNKEIQLADPPVDVIYWMLPYLNYPTKPGFIWIIDHWESEMANEVYISNWQTLHKGQFMGDDKILTPDEIRVLVQSY